MTRIIAGTARGRRLVVPKQGTRPTSDRVRESWFATLDAMVLREGRTWRELRVVDLFAGSGALGLEAASRGAESVVFVEQARPALSSLRTNVATIALPGCSIEAVDVLPWCRQRHEPPFDLAVADPPYDMPAATVTQLLTDLEESLAPGFMVVVERRRGDEPCMPAGWEVVDRRYGDTVLWYGRAQAQ
jgi:16S rRNA (guanine966-N2)-methyltransferase